jgi:hypothetical protein
MGDTSCTLIAPRPAERPTRRGWPALLLVPAVLGGTACGSGERSAAPGTTVPAVTTTLSASEVAKAKARSVVLTAADVPGFTRAAPTTESSPDPQLACAKEAPTLVATTNSPTKVEGETFERGPDGDLTVSSTADVLDPAQATTLLAELASPKLAACFQRAFRDAFNAELGGQASLTVKVVPSSSPVAGAEQAASLDIQGTVSAAGNRVPMHFRWSFVRKQGTVATLDYGAFGAGYDKAEHDRLLALITSRL